MRYKKLHKFSNAIKNIDMFGYPVMLQYHKDEFRKKSLIGGMLSFILAILILSQFSWSIQKLKNQDYSII